MAKRPQAKGVRLAPDLTVSEDIFTTASAIVGVRGSGKTNDGVVLAEQATHIGVPAVVFDPMSVWWGLKSSPDGRSAGLPFYIFGGPRGDVPLEAEAGAVVARFAVDYRVPIILDVSDFSKGKQRRFAAEFFEALFDLKNRKRDPIFVILDEVQRFCPQRIPKGEEYLTKSVGAIEDIVTGGRSRGIGAALIGPRAASINKNILEACDNLFAMRTIGRNDRAAINDWIVEQQGEEEQKAELLRNLPRLRQGEGYFWSPAVFDVFKRVNFAARETFDSSHTPRPGQKRIEPRVFAAVDLDKLRGEIAESVARKKADDPAELRRQIVDLRNQLKAASSAAATATPQTIETIVEVPVVPEAVVRALRDLGASLEAWAPDLRVVHGRIGKLLDGIESAGAAVKDAISQADKTPAAPGRARENSRSPVQRDSKTEVYERTRPLRRDVATPPALIGSNGSTLGKADRAILIALAQTPEGCDKGQLGILAGYSSRSSHFENTLSKLRTAGYITRDMPIRITRDGLDALGHYDPLPTGADLRAYWLSRLGKAERAILSALFEAYPRGLRKDEISDRSGYSATSSHFENTLSKLRILKLVQGGGSAPITASDTLFS